MKASQVLLLSAIFFFLYFFVPPVGAECLKKPDLKTMDGLFLESLRDQNSARKDQIAILPFTDISLQEDDEIFSKLFSYVLFNKHAAKQMELIHPYVVDEALLGLSNTTKTLPSNETLKRIAEKLKARFVISGSFQRQNEFEMRVDIYIYDNKSGSILSPPHSYTTAIDDKLISHTVASARLAFEKMGIKVSPLKMQDHAGLMAYRYYIKGIELGKKYDPSQLNLGIVWLEKALLENYHKFDEATYALSTSHFRLALVQKLARQDFTENFIRGKTDLRYLSGDKENIPPIVRRLSERYLLADMAFHISLQNLMEKKTQGAYQKSQNGLKLVPEDGMLESVVLHTQSLVKPEKQISARHAVCL